MKSLLFIIGLIFSSSTFAAVNFNYEFTATSLEKNITWYSLYCNNDDGSKTVIKGSGLNVITIPGDTLCNKYSVIVMNQQGLWSDHSNVIDVREIADTPVTTPTPAPSPEPSPTPEPTPEPTPSPTPTPTPVPATPKPTLPAPVIKCKIIPITSNGS